MSVKSNVLPIALSSFNTTGLSSTYQAINSSGLGQACFFLRIVNDSNQDITVSFDGSSDHEFVQAGTIFELNCQSNHRPASGVANMAKGTKVYVKGSSGTGLIYLSGYYQN
jgi:hypothetical protein